MSKRGENEVKLKPAAQEKDPLSFLKHQRSKDNKRDIKMRRIDFKEIYQGKDDLELTQQAERCLDCGNPYCEWKCPLHNYIPNWLDLVAKKQYSRAAELMHETNPLPEICGRVCPQDRLCEQACTLNTGFGAVTIGDIEKNIADKALAKRWRPDLSQVEATGKKVAIVGAGPAGLGCAELLARRGVKAVVFDRYPEIGGLLTFGIPGFKLEKDLMQRRREFLQDIGVEFCLQQEIGKDISIESLQEDYDALFLAMGTYQPVQGGLEGADANNVLNALDYLIGNVNQQQSFGMDNYPYRDLSGKRVVVLGGGDTAMDCVRSAIRQQAKEVTCVYRRDQESMPGSPQEVRNATEEGVKFLYNRQPIKINVENDTLRSVTVAETELVDKGDGKRASFQVNESKTEALQADVVILAFGFKASPADWFANMGLEQDAQGLVKTQSDPHSENGYRQQTSVSGVFAGGDMVRGADLVVTAIAEGRKAANEILEHLSV